MSKKKGKELVPVSIRAVTALGMQERDTELTTLAHSTANITAITNADGYNQVRSARLVLKNLRVEIQNAGKGAREDATAFSKAVIAEEKRLVGLIHPEEVRLEAMETAEDARVEAERQAEIDREIARQAALQERIAELNGNRMLTPTSGASLLADHISDLESIAVDESFEELKQEAETVKAAGLAWLREIHAAAVAHEAEQKRLADERVELQRLRKEAAERAAAQAEEERQAKAARDAEAARHAEHLRRQAEDAAKEQAARQKIIDNNNARIAAEQRAAQDKLDAEAARQAEAQREIERQQEELRIASLPQPVAESPVIETLAEWTRPESVTAMLQEGRFGAEPETTIPTADEIVSALVDIYGESDETVLSWLRGIDWNAEVSEAA